MTTDEAGLLIATLAAAYPRQQLEPATIEVYARNLADLDHDLAAAAITRIIATSTFFPTIAEIRTAAAEIRCDLPTSTEAWLMVTSGYATEEMPLEVRDARAAVGGSWAIRTSENPTALRSQFRKAYEELRQRTLDEVAVPALDPGARPALERGEAA